MNPIRTYLIETWGLITGMGPYLLLGFLVTGLLYKWIRQQWIERHLSLHNGPITLSDDIAVSLLVGFLLTGLVGASASDDLLANPPRGIHISILLTNLIATPFSICLAVSIPLLWH